MSSSDDTVISGDEAPSLDQKSRLIVFPRESAILSSVLRDPNVKRIGPGIVIAKKNNKTLQEALLQIPHIRFRKARDIPKGDGRKLKPFAEKTYAIIQYSFKGVSPQQKKKVQRLFVNTPCIRLRPGVILFPYLRARQKNRYYILKDGSTLMSSKEFAAEARKAGIKLLRWTKLKLANQAAEEIVEQAFRNNVQTDLEAIEAKLRLLIENIGNQEIETKQLRMQMATYGSRFSKTKLKLKVLKDIWEFDSDKELKRVYNVLLRARRKLHE